MKKSMALLTYNRFDYFKPVIESIIIQTVNGRPVLDIYDFYVSQDGLRPDEPLESAEQHKLIADYLTELSKKNQSIKIIKQPNNLGIGWHFNYIERLLFEEMKYDFVVFFEDDLLLAPGFMQMMDLMAEKFRDDPRIGMFSAFNPEVCTLEKQKEQKLRYVAMGHNWGFGLFRSFWLRRQPLIDNYLDFIKNSPYNKRDNNLIFSWLSKINFSCLGSSQDHIKACTTNALGCIRIAPMMNFGIPIGRLGVNFNQELFAKLGFDQIVAFDEMPTTAPDLHEVDFRNLYKAQAQGYLSKVFSEAINEPNRDFFAAFEEKAKQGLFHPRFLIPEQFSDFLAQKKILEFFDIFRLIDWKDGHRFDKNLPSLIDKNKEKLEGLIANNYEACTILFLLLGRNGGEERAGRTYYSIFMELLKCDEYKIKYSKFHQIIPMCQPEDIPDLPSMDLDGLGLFEKRLTQSTCFLEFGAGGSTILAAKKEVVTVYSVESDLNWANATRLKAENLNTKTKIVLHYVDIGATKAWGWPADDLTKNRWPSYSQSIFIRLFREGAKPNLILIDGRFRVACFLTSLAYSSPGTRILFDDYYDRPNYHVVERFLKPASRSGRMAEFVVESLETSDFIFSEIYKFIYDPS